MLDVIQNHILENRAAWNIGLPGIKGRLRPMLRANPELDRPVRELASGQVGTVIFWFAPDSNCPLLVSKIMGSTITPKAIAECAELQQTANRRLGQHIFPQIYGTKEIGGVRVIFFEAIEGPNFEIQLARAVSGPERSIRSFHRVVTQQLRDLGGVLRGLRGISLAVERVTWTRSATNHAQRFIALCPEARSVVDDGCLSSMARSLDTQTLEVHFTLTEDHIANYLPGGRAVDQVVSDIRELCTDWPGPVGALRILLAYFRASAMREAFLDYSWLDTLAYCIDKGPNSDPLRMAVRAFLEDVGLGTDEPETVWAFVMGVYFMRACQEIEFHADSPSVTERLRREFLEGAVTLERIRSAWQRRAPARQAVIAPKLNHHHLDGEFANRMETTFYAERYEETALPRWVRHAVALHARFAQLMRRAGILGAVRSVYGAILDFIDRRT